MVISSACVLKNTFCKAVICLKMATYCYAFCPVDWRMFLGSQVKIVLHPENWSKKHQMHSMCVR